MTETRRTTELRVHPRADVVPFPDPETHEQMAADVERRGIVVPLDILADGTVLDGRTRLSIARVLGLAEVPVRVVDAPDPFDYMVKAALLRRDLTKGQKAALLTELPEYRKAKAEAAERRNNLPNAESALVREQEQPRAKAAEVVAPMAGVSPRYVEMAERVRREDPEAFEQVKAGAVSLVAATAAINDTAPDRADTEEDVPTPKTPTGRLPVQKVTRPVRPWARHFTRWCRGALPEDRPVLLEMAREIDQALQRIGATR